MELFSVVFRFLFCVRPRTGAGERHCPPFISSFWFGLEKPWICVHHPQCIYKRYLHTASTPNAYCVDRSFNSRVLSVFSLSRTVQLVVRKPGYWCYAFVISLLCAVPARGQDFAQSHIWTRALLRLRCHLPEPSQLCSHVVGLT